jgi:urease accessory protein
VRLALAGVEAAASVWNGLLLARILGPDSDTVRRTVVAVLSVLREDRPLPRVWLC